MTLTFFSCFLKSHTNFGLLLPYSYPVANGVANRALVNPFLECVSVCVHETQMCFLLPTLGTDPDQESWFVS